LTAEAGSSGRLNFLQTAYLLLQSIFVSFLFDIQEEFFHMQPRNVYDYTDVGSSVSAQSTILRKTYGLLGLSFLPAAAGAFVAMATGLSLFSFTGNYWIAVGIFFAFFYGISFLIEKNRHSNVGAALLMVLTFGLVTTYMSQDGQQHIYSVEPFDVVKKEGSLYTFQVKHKLENAGSFKVAYRMFPKNADLPHRQDFCYVKWLD